MKPTLLMLAMIVTGSTACASGSAASPAVEPECAQPITSVPFSSAFTDSAQAADVLLPLLAVRDTVEAIVMFRDGPTVYVDTLAVPDSTTREALEAQLEEVAQPIMPMHFREIELFRDAGAAPRFAVRQGRFCRPVMYNRDELAAALQRAQRQIQAAGSVVLWILVDTTGAPTEVRVHRSSGNEYIDVAAVGVGYVARFTPAMRAGRPMRVWVQQPITFTMQPR